MTGRNGVASASGAGRPVRLGYAETSVRRETADEPNDPIFTGHWSESISPNTAGTWSKVPTDFQVAGAPYYFSYKLAVSILDWQDNRVGGGTVSCVLYDGSAA